MRDTARDNVTLINDFSVTNNGLATLFLRRRSGTAFTRRRLSRFEVLLRGCQGSANGAIRCSRAYMQSVWFCRRGALVSGALH